MKHYSYKNKILIILCLTFNLNVYCQNSAATDSNDKGVLTGIWESIKSTFGIDQPESNKARAKKLRDKKAPEICKIILANNPEKE